MMNKFKALISLIAISMVVSLASCGGGGSKSPIVGSWTVTKAEGFAAASSQGIVYAFTDDGEATIGEGIMQSKYTYTLEGENLKMDYNGEGKIVLTWTVKIDGDKMTMDNASDADQKFWLEKKK